MEDVLRYRVDRTYPGRDMLTIAFFLGFATAREFMRREAEKAELYGQSATFTVTCTETDEVLEKTTLGL